MRVGELEEELMHLRCLTPSAQLCNGRASEVIERHEYELKKAE
jgi:hypothetical protein